MTPEARRARGIAAKALIEDETLKAAWAELEAELTEQWAGAGKWGEWASRKERDRLWIELKTIRALRSKLATYAAHAPRD